MPTAKRSSRTIGLAHATNLIRKLCHIAGQPDLIEDVRASFSEIGLTEAIQLHDDDAIYNWLAEAISYQGVSDSVAAGYLERHGTVAAVDVRQGLTRPSLCPKLQSHWHFEGCGCRKAARKCNEPRLLKRCPLPQHDLRNASLNQAAYSLHFFMRDVTGGDFVSWVDTRLANADRGTGNTRVQSLCRAVVEPLRHVYGVSDKILNMTLANLLLAGDPERERWVVAGAGMIAIDSLVHNWLHRSGILARLGAEHPYGPACYQAGGCATIIGIVADRINAKAFNSAYPSTFPRFVQKAIWQFCAGMGLNRCNGIKIDDHKRCDLKPCPLFAACDRVTLLPRKRWIASG